jgi:hypothetical protein
VRNTRGFVWIEAGAISLSVAAFSHNRRISITERVPAKRYRTLLLLNLKKRSHADDGASTDLTKISALRKEQPFSNPLLWNVPCPIWRIVQIQHYANNPCLRRSISMECRLPLWTKAIIQKKISRRLSASKTPNIELSPLKAFFRQLTREVDGIPSPLQAGRCISERRGCDFLCKSSIFRRDQIQH